MFLVTAACAVEQGVGAGATEAQADRVRRLASILDYVAADYPAAVADGKVVNDGEYREQIAFLDDAQALARKIEGGAAFDADLARLQYLVDAKAAAGEVAAGSRALRRRVLDAYGVILAPSVPPSRERAAELYATNCVRCHGPAGGGDGTEAARLDPRPRSFRDPAVMAELHPARAFNALTDGVRGTAMPSFGTLSAADRWSLAFHLFTFRHDPTAVARGAVAYARANRGLAATPTRLAGLSDGEIDGRLAAAGLTEAERGDVLAWLRVEAPFRTEGAPLDPARRLLASGLAERRAGRPDRARQLVGEAYLDGFDPFEGALRGRDAALVVTVEQRFLSLRQRIGDAAASSGEVERDAVQLMALLDRAEERLGAGGGGASAGGTTAFISALLIILREGVEAALLIMLLLGMARRAAASSGRGDARAIHAGWLAAVAVGLLGWFASGLIVGMGGGRREIMEGSISLFAAGVLLWAGHFVFARADARRRVDAIKRRLAGATSGARRRWVLAGLAFLAVFREALEVVLFLRTVALDRSAPAGAVALGVLAGAVLLGGAVYALHRLGRRLKPGPLLATMGTLLCLLAVVLAGKGVHALQLADVLPMRSLALPVVDWLGVYPTLEGLLAQLTVLAAFAVIALVAWLRAGGESDDGAATRPRGQAGGDGPATSGSDGPTAARADGPSV